MTDSLTRAIEARLQRYLAGADSLAEFEAWLVPETWDLSPQSDHAAHDLATAITLRIAEFTNGDWTEDELRDALAGLYPAVTITSTGVVKGQSITLLGRGSFSVADRPHSGAFA